VISIEVILCIVSRFKKRNKSESFSIGKTNDYYWEEEKEKPSALNDRLLKLVGTIESPTHHTSI